MMIPRTQSEKRYHQELNNPAPNTEEANWRHFLDHGEKDTTS
jgi:hypothetical protein